MAKKTIILSKTQLDEIVGGNSAWLDNAGSDFKEDALNSVYATGKLDNCDGEPLNTDEFSDELSLDYGPWIPGGRGGNKSAMVYTNGMIACSKKDWANKNILREDSNEVLQNANVSISPTDAKNISATGDTSVAHAIDGNISQSAGRMALSRLNRAEKGAKAGDPQAMQTYQNMGGEQGKKALSKSVERNSNINAVTTGKNIFNHSEKSKTNKNDGVLHLN